MHVIGQTVRKAGRVIMKSQSQFGNQGGRTQFNPDPYRRFGLACTLNIFQKLIPEHLSEFWTSLQSVPAKHTIILSETVARKKKHHILF